MAGARDLAAASDDSLERFARHGLRDVAAHSLATTQDVGEVHG